MTFVWLKHLFGVGQVGQEVDIPKVIAVILLGVTFYRMGHGIIFFEKTTDAYKILYDKRSLRHQFLYFLATLGRLYLFIILVVLIGYSFTLGKVGYIIFLLLCGVLIFSVRWLIHLKSHFVRYFNLKVISEEYFYPIFLKK